MLCRYGVQIAVAINAAVFLVFVKCVPCAFKLHEFFLGCQVTRLAVTAQLVVIDKCKFLAGTHLIHHTAYPVHKLATQCGIIGPGICKCQCREIMSGSMAFQLGMGRVPTIGYGVALCAKSVCVTVVVELLCHVKGQQGTDVKVTV